jgi:hypothetical protein
MHYEGGSTGVVGGSQQRELCRQDTGARAKRNMPWAHARAHFDVHDGNLPQLHAAFTHLGVCHPRVCGLWYSSSRTG